MKWFTLTAAFAALLLIAGTACAQYEIGHRTESFYDSTRDRNVGVEVYYPADIAGDDVAVSMGSFPLVVFGHGFFMPWSDYSNIWQFLVPTGYIMAFLTTEGSAFPSHGDYGLDYLVVASGFETENESNASPYYQHLNGREGFVGHSMGGGAAWLAAAGNNDIETVVGLAPAETSPSAISAASDVTVPALVISGSSDGVTPPQDNHGPIYDLSASDCKAYVSLNEGSHCGYADDGTICDLGEFLFNGMDRETQQTITHQLLQFWLGFFLKNQEDAGDAFEAYCASNPDTDLTTNCTLTAVAELERLPSLYPVPASSFFMLPGAGLVEVYDETGRNIFRGRNMQGVPVDCSQWPQGCYLVRFDQDGETMTARLPVIHH